MWLLVCCQSRDTWSLSKVRTWHNYVVNLKNKKDNICLSELSVFVPMEFGLWIRRFVIWIFHFLCKRASLRQSGKSTDFCQCKRLTGQLKSDPSYECDSGCSLWTPNLCQHEWIEKNLCVPDLGEQQIIKVSVISVKIGLHILTTNLHVNICLATALMHWKKRYLELHKNMNYTCSTA